MAVKIRYFFIFCFWLASAVLPLHPQDGHADNEFVIDGFKLETLPGGTYYPNFIENLAPDAVWLTEESNGFGVLDQPKVYFEGDSWTQFQWHYAGLRINSALTAGAPALQLPFLAIGSMSLSGESPARRDHGFTFSPRAPERAVSRLMLSTVAPNLGGWTPLGKLAVVNHASLRAEDLYETRRRIAGNYQFDYSFEKKSRRRSLLLAASYFNLERLFNDFNERDRQFNERGNLLQFLSRWQGSYAAGTLSLDLVVNAGRRGRLFAETGRYPQETYEQDQRSWLAAASWSGRAGNLKFSWIREWQERLPAVPGAGKDLMDIDGQGFFPFEKWGRFSASTLALSADKKYDFSLLGRKASLEPYVDLSAVFVSAAEKTGAASGIYFAGQPYLAVLWRGGSDYRNQRRSAAAGALLRMDFSERLAFNARLSWQYQGLSFQAGRNDLGFLQAGGAGGFTWQAGRRTRLSLSYGSHPYPLGDGAADFLETRSQGADIYFWNDTDRDARFQDGEQGGLFGRSGGSGHFASPELKPSRRETLELLVSQRLSTHFNLNVKGLYKKIRRPLWVNFADEYGHTEELDGREYYILDRPFQAFELGNASFAKEPFYAQFLVQVRGEKARRWYFSFSFLAHMGMGTTAFGNGPEANDVGVLSESQAFPDTWINGFGRLDGDRAFVGKIFFGYHLSPRLFLAGSVKYRDGNPFAFISARQLGGRWILTYQTIKGEDEHSRKGGPREDCIWDFNFKLGYDISLFGKRGRLECSVFNLLDFGGELSENAFSNDRERLANELQLPRSLRLGIVLEF